MGTGSEKELKELFNEAERAARFDRGGGALSLFATVIERCENYLLENAHLHDRTEHVIKTLALAYNNRGHQQYLKVEFDEAITDYTHAIRLNPSLAVAFYNRGLIHYRLGRFLKAIEDQKAAIRLNPDFASAKQCMEEALREMQQQRPPLLDDDFDNNSQNRVTRNSFLVDHITGNIHNNQHVQGRSRDVLNNSSFMQNSQHNVTETDSHENVSRDSNSDMESSHTENNPSNISVPTLSDSTDSETDDEGNT